MPSAGDVPDRPGSSRDAIAVSPAHLMIGASAIDVSPSRKKRNISASSSFTRELAPLNSFQTKTPHSAEIMVFPSPIANDVAGPIIGTYYATKFAIVPRPHTMPPRTPQA